jgi:tRNA modification GTPase
MIVETNDTIVALATPPGVGAIAVIRLSGSSSITFADSLFKGKRLADCPTHTAHFGRIVREDGSTVDEVVLTLFRGPRSYTGEDVVEVSCHGSTFLQQELIQNFLRAGARMAQPGEFTLRAFLNGKMDLSQAEAVADLIASESSASAELALKQLRGGFKQEIARLRERLIEFASLIELELDFSEEDVEFADRGQLKALVLELKRHISSLLSSFQLGNAIKTGVSTVIAGRPNAGKSTLLNALLNEERAIVSDIAGTTRDTIEEVLNIHGVRFRLIDTAGIREAHDQIEAIGVRKTFEKVREASLLIYVWDITSGMTLQDLYNDLEQLLVSPVHCIVVCNKMDRNPLFEVGWIANPSNTDIHPYLLPSKPITIPEHVHLADLVAVPISASNQMNIEYLKEALYRAALGDSVRLEGTVVTNARHYDALRRAEAALVEVLQGLDTGLTGDFIAQDLRRSLNFLGEITGEIGVEDLLGSIFGKFCIGK